MSDVTDLNALIERIDAGECFNAATASGKARVLLFACQRDIDAQRNVVMKAQAIDEANKAIAALQDAVRVLEGLDG